MLVREPTFRPMLAEAREVEMYGERLLIPALNHLLALKLHALKHTHAGRYLKDFLDVENLVRVNQIDLRSDSTRILFLKYSDEETYEKSSGRENRDESQLHESATVPDLEFPVAPDFRSEPPQLEFQVMLRRIAETMPWRSTRPGEQERRLREKIPQEFVL